MPTEKASTDLARVLAELVDTALADQWSEERPTMALLWQQSSDPDDLRLAIKEVDADIEAELAPLADDGSYLAVAHSNITLHPPAELGLHACGSPVRITVAVDHDAQSGVLRHRNGTTQWFGAIELPVATLVRSLLWLEPAA